MSFWTHTINAIGAFVEKDDGNTFEYSDNVSSDKLFGEYPHIVWVGGRTNDQGFRFANVKKTVAYIVTDEDVTGNLVIEKWNIKSNRKYFA
jgi:hypothetical protein